MSEEHAILRPSRILKALIKITYNLRVVTGLLIRMPIHAQAFRIGGADTYPMVSKRIYKIGNTYQELEVPYIPGSSIKGRMRSLLELSLGLKLYSSDLKIWQHVRSIGSKEGTMSLDEFVKDVEDRCVIDDLFGYPAVNYSQIVDAFKKRLSENEDEAKRKASLLFNKLAITRLLFTDLFPSNEYVENLYRAKGGILSISDFLEEKSENRIDRVTAAADPREIVRVKPDVVFSGVITMLVFDNDGEVINKYLDTLIKGMRLIELTYLGGSGSRGYGRVRFEDINLDLIKLPELERIRSEIYKDLKEFSEGLSDILKVIKERVFSGNF